MSRFYSEQYDAIATRIEKALQRLEPKQMFRVLRASEMEDKNLNQYTFLIELKIKINDELYVIYENTGSMFWYDTDDHFREKVRSMYGTMVSQLLREVLRPKEEPELKYLGKIIPKEHDSNYAYFIPCDHSLIHMKEGTDQNALPDIEKVSLRRTHGDVYRGNCPKCDKRFEANVNDSSI